MVLVSPWPRSHPTPPHSDRGVAINFDFEDLSDAQFETLVVFLRQRLLGISVRGFAKGPDGAGVTQSSSAQRSFNPEGRHLDMSSPRTRLTLHDLLHLNGLRTGRQCPVCGWEAHTAIGRRRPGAVVRRSDSTGRKAAEAVLRLPPTKVSSMALHRL